MYNKEIYQDWELHPDATQLEIKYKFFVKFIDVLNVKSLIHKGDSAIQNQFSNKDVIRKWQNFKLSKILNQFNEISDYRFPENEWFQSENIFHKSVFMLGDILNSLKVTNYKANELEIYYEPVMFKLAQKNLNINELEEWVSMLSTRVKSYNTNSKIKFDLAITIDKNNVNNIMWFIENLCLCFKDISSWYQNQFAIKDVPPNEKNIIINVMNHMIVYALSDFYIKLHSVYEKRSFHETYEVVLSKISNLLNDGRFAINAYKEISIFLSKILADGYISHNDSIIKNFMSIINVSCSDTNKEKFEDAIFKLLNNKEEYKKIVSKNLAHKELIEKQKQELSNQRIENSEQVVSLDKALNTNLVNNSNVHELDNNKKYTSEIKLTLEEQDQLLDELENFSKKHQQQKQDKSNINLKSIFKDTKSIDEDITWGEVISTSKLGGE